MGVFVKPDKKVGYYKIMIEHDRTRAFRINYNTVMRLELSQIKWSDKRGYLR